MRNRRLTNLVLCPGHVDLISGPEQLAILRRRLAPEFFMFVHRLVQAVLGYVVLVAVVVGLIPVMAALLPELVRAIF